MNPQIGSGGPPAPQDRQRYLEDSVSQPDQFPTADHGATHGIDRCTVIGGGGVVGLALLAQRLSRPVVGEVVRQTRAAVPPAVRLVPRARARPWSRPPTSRWGAARSSTRQRWW